MILSRVVDVVSPDNYFEFVGKWNEYLHGVDEECYQRLELLVEQMKAGAGVTEKLKATDQMKWVGLMNNLKACVEAIVINKLVYEKYWENINNYWTKYKKRNIIICVQQFSKWRKTL